MRKSTLLVGLGIGQRIFRFCSGNHHLPPYLYATAPPPYIQNHSIVFLALRTVFKVPVHICRNYLPFGFVPWQVINHQFYHVKIILDNVDFSNIPVILQGMKYQTQAQPPYQDLTLTLSGYILHPAPLQRIIHHHGLPPYFKRGHWYGFFDVILGISAHAFHQVKVFP